jgi:DNA-binding transcriptional MerR regulator
VSDGQPPLQEALFSVGFPAEVPDALLGYRGTTACSAAGITYRQLDYWFKDILVLKVVKRLLDTGVSLHNIRVAVEHLRARGVDDLANVTLLSDGTTVYECTSAEEVVDLLAGGQGVFGIAVSGALKELHGSLAHLPAERAEPTAAAVPAEPTAADELGQRGRRRTASA